MESTQNTNDNESQVSTLDIDPKVLAAYIIFGVGAILLIAAFLRLGYWCMQYRARKKEVNQLIQNGNINNGSEDSGSNVYCGRGVISKTNDYTSDNDSLQIRMDDMFGQRKDKKNNMYSKKGDKKKAHKEDSQPIYAVVKKKKKEDTHASILAMEAGHRSKKEDFWHIDANAVHDNESLTGSSMRLHRDRPLVKSLREEDENSTSAGSEVTNSVASTYIEKEKNTGVNSERQSKIVEHEERRSVNSSDDEQLQNVMKGAHETDNLSVHSRNSKVGARKSKRGTEDADKTGDNDKNAYKRGSTDSKRDTQAASRSSKLSNRESRDESKMKQELNEQSESRDRASQMSQNERKNDTGNTSRVLQRENKTASVISNSDKTNVNDTEDVSRQKGKIISDESKGTKERSSKLSDSGVSRTSEISESDNDRKGRRSELPSYAAAGIIGASSILSSRNRTSDNKDNDNEENKNVNSVRDVSQNDAEKLQRRSQISQQEQRRSQLSDTNKGQERSLNERDSVNGRASQVTDSGVNEISEISEPRQVLYTTPNTRASVESDDGSVKRVKDTPQDNTRESRLSSEGGKAANRASELSVHKYKGESSQPQRNSDSRRNSKVSEADLESYHRNSQLSNYAAGGIAGTASVSQRENKTASVASDEDTESLKRVKDTPQARSHDSTRDSQLSHEKTENSRRGSQISAQESKGVDGTSQYKTDNLNYNKNQTSHERENDSRRTSQVSQQDDYSQSVNDDKESIHRKSGPSNYAAAGILGMGNLSQRGDRTSRHSENKTNDANKDTNVSGNENDNRRTSHLSDSRAESESDNDRIERETQPSHYAAPGIMGTSNEYKAEDSSKNENLKHHERENDIKGISSGSQQDDYRQSENVDKEKSHKKSGGIFGKMKRFMKKDKKNPKTKDRPLEEAHTNVSDYENERTSQFSDSITFSARKESEPDKERIKRGRQPSNYVPVIIGTSDVLQSENNPASVLSEEDTESVRRIKDTSQARSSDSIRESQLSQEGNKPASRTSEVSTHKHDDELSPLQKEIDSRRTSEVSQDDNEGLHRKSQLSNYAAAGIARMSNTTQRDSTTGSVISNEESDHRTTDMSEYKKNDAKDSDHESENDSRRTSQVSQQGDDHQLENADKDNVHRKSNISNYAAAGISGMSNVSQHKNNRGSNISNDSERDRSQEEIKDFGRVSPLLAQENPGRDRTSRFSENNTDDSNKNTNLSQYENVSRRTSQLSEPSIQRIERETQPSNYAAPGIIGTSNALLGENKTASVISDEDTESIRRDNDTLQNQDSTKKSHLSQEGDNVAERTPESSEYKHDGELSQLQKENDSRRNSKVSDIDDESHHRKSQLSNYAAAGILGASNVSQGENKNRSVNDDTESNHRARGILQEASQDSRRGSLSSTEEGGDRTSRVSEYNAGDRTSRVSEYNASDSNKNKNLSPHESENDSRRISQVSQQDDENMKRKSAASNYAAAGILGMGNVSQRGDRTSVHTKNKTDDINKDINVSDNDNDGRITSHHSDSRADSESDKGRIERETQPSHYAAPGIMGTSDEYKTEDSSKNENLKHHETEYDSGRISQDSPQCDNRQSENADKEESHKKSGASGGIFGKMKRFIKKDKKSQKTKDSSQEEAQDTKRMSQLSAQDPDPRAVSAAKESEPGKERIETGRQPTNYVPVIIGTSDVLQRENNPANVISDEDSKGGERTSRLSGYKTDDSNISHHEEGNNSKRVSQVLQKSDYNQSVNAHKESIHRESGISNYGASGILGMSNISQRENNRGSDIFDDSERIQTTRQKSQEEPQDSRRTSQLSVQDSKGGDRTSRLSGYRTDDSNVTPYDRENDVRSTSPESQQGESDADQEIMRRKSAAAGILGSSNASSKHENRDENYNSNTGKTTNLSENEAERQGRSSQISQHEYNSGNTTSDVTELDADISDAKNRDIREENETDHNKKSETEPEKQNIYRRSGPSNLAAAGIIGTSQASESERKSERVDPENDTEIVNTAESQAQKEEIERRLQQEIKSKVSNYGTESDSRPASRLSAADAYKPSERSEPDNESIQRNSGISNSATAGILGASQVVNRGNKTGSIISKEDAEGFEESVANKESHKRSSQLSTNETHNMEDSQRTSDLSSYESTERRSPLLHDSRTLPEDTTQPTAKETDVNEISRTAPDETAYAGAPINERVKELTSATEHTEKVSKADDLPETPGQVQVPEGLSAPSENTFTTATTDDIKAESINPGSFALLQSRWKMREAQIQSGLNAPMLSPRVGLKYSEDDTTGSSETAKPTQIVREPQVFTQKYTNDEDEGRMFSFANSRGALASIWGDTGKSTPKGKTIDKATNTRRTGGGVLSILTQESEDEPNQIIDSKTSTLNSEPESELGRLAAEERERVAGVEQIYMDPQEILQKPAEGPTSPTFALPPHPPSDSESVENQSTLGSDIMIQPMTSLPEKTEVEEDAERPSSDSDTSAKNKKLRFNDDIEEIHRISVFEDDVSLASNTPVVSYSNYDGDEDDDDDDDDVDDDDVEDSNSMIIKDEESDDGSGTGFKSLSERPPTPILTRK